MTAPIVFQYPDRLWFLALIPALLALYGLLSWRTASRLRRRGGVRRTATRCSELL